MDRRFIVDFFSSSWHLALLTFSSNFDPAFVASSPMTQSVFTPSHPPRFVVLFPCETLGFSQRVNSPRCVPILITTVIRIVSFFMMQYAHRVGGVEYFEYYLVFTAGSSPIIRFPRNFPSRCSCSSFPASPLSIYLCPSSFLQPLLSAVAEWNFRRELCHYRVIRKS